MKTNIPSQLLRLLVAANLSLFALTRAHADEDGSTVTANLSAPGKPATLRINMPWADIHIVGVGGNTVTVQSTLNQKGAKPRREDGLRRLDDELTFELTEKNNVVTLGIAGDNPWSSHDAEFNVSVPRTMALDVKTEAGGDLTVKDIEGDIDVSNMNGEVRLEGISGSTVVSTMNGEVHAVYSKAPQKLVSITSMNGEVELRVPAETKANVRLRTHNGSILTDFDEAVLKTKTEGKSGGYSYGYSGDAREAARAATDAAKMAIQVAVDIGRDVAHQVAMDMKMADEQAHLAKVQAEDQAKADSDQAKADADEAKAEKEADEAEASAPATATAGSATLVAPVAPKAPHTPRAAHAPRPPMPPMTGGKTVTGTLNGGGVDIKISTMNGEITLRQTGAAGAKTTDNVTVKFEEPDRFTDVRENHSSSNSTDYLDALSNYLQETAAARLGAGQKLVITVTDIDLAGDNMLGSPDMIRVMKDIYSPKIKLKFQLLGADGKVVKEGERRLNDTNYLTQAGRPGSSEPLYYDKQLLKQWVQDEFGGKS